VLLQISYAQPQSRPTPGRGWHVVWLLPSPSSREQHTGQTPCHHGLGPLPTTSSSTPPSCMNSDDTHTILPHQCTLQGLSGHQSRQQAASTAAGSSSPLCPSSTSSLPPPKPPPTPSLLFSHTCADQASELVLARVEGGAHIAVAGCRRAGGGGGEALLAGQAPDAPLVGRIRPQRAILAVGGSLLRGILPCRALDALRGPCCIAEAARRAGHTGDTAVGCRAGGVGACRAAAAGGGPRRVGEGPSWAGHATGGACVGGKETNGARRARCGCRLVCKLTPWAGGACCGALAPGKGAWPA
jgi:hypothetical protein